MKIGKLIFVITAALVVALDQVTKMIVRAKLPPGKNISIVDGIFSLTHIQNPGALFGMFPSGKSIFIIISIIAILGMTYISISVSLPNFVQFALGLLAGGIAGNFIDRVVFGYVTDFLYITHWPVFNVADTVIDIGLAICGFYALKYGKNF